jgi:Fe-S cluster assembly protein SufD
MAATAHKLRDVSAPFEDALEAASQKPAPFWLREARAAARARFASLGLPDTHLESWKYTSLKPLRASGFAPAAPDARATLPAPLIDSDRLVLVDGFFRPELSHLPPDLPARAFVGGWAQLIAADEALAQRIFARIAPRDEAMAALNVALAEDGAVVYLPAGARLEKPLEILALGASASMANARLIVVLEMGAEATLIERHDSNDRGFSNVVGEIAVGDGAHLRHLRLQEESESSIHVTVQAVRLGRDARYNSFSLLRGAALSRHQIHLRLDAPGGEAQIDGALLLHGDQHGDMTSLIEHAAPHCASKQMVRAVLDERAHGVFQGKIVVHEGAQKSDGAQLSSTLLLARGARIDAKPELEIFADDVQCRHGATTGAIDETALFYLRSRGIPEREARGLLIQSFVTAVLERIDREDLRHALESHVAGWMGGVWAEAVEAAP